MKRKQEMPEKSVPRVEDRGIFRMTDIQRLGVECQCFPTFETVHLPEGKTRMVRRMRQFRIVGREVVEFEEYYEGNLRKTYDKKTFPLKAIYPQIRRVTDASGKTIARRLKQTHPLRWLLPIGNQSEE